MFKYAVLLGVLASSANPASGDENFVGVGTGVDADRAFIFAARRGNRDCVRAGGNPGTGTEIESTRQSLYVPSSGQTILEFASRVLVPCEGVEMEEID